MLYLTTFIAIRKCCCERTDLFLFPHRGPEMARNDSSQVAMLLDHGYQEKSPTKLKAHTRPRDDHTPRTQPDKQTKEDSHPAVTSCCPLGDLKKISWSTSQKPLEFTSTHTVLIDVRPPLAPGPSNPSRTVVSPPSGAVVQHR